MSAREYHQAALERSGQAWIEGARTMEIDGPTGSDVPTIVAMAAAEFMGSESKAIVIGPRSILDYFKDMMAQAMPAGVLDGPDARVAFVTPIRAMRNLDRLKRMAPDLLVLLEDFPGTEDRYARIAGEFPGARVLQQGRSGPTPISADVVIDGSRILTPSL